MTRFSLILLLLAGSLCMSPLYAGWQDTLQGMIKSKDNAPSNEDMAWALREALNNGVDSAVNKLGVSDGFWGNPAFRIPVPASLQKTDNVMRRVGMKKQSDEFVLSLNRAAEKAVPVSKDIFLESIHNITWQDARRIIQGPDDAATQYFRKSGESRLRQEFLPIIQQTTQKAGVTVAYKRVQQEINKNLPFLKPDWVDIDNYVMDRTLDALFAMIAEEEHRIRQDPVARTTDLLKQVFGWAAKK